MGWTSISSTVTELANGDLQVVSVLRPEVASPPPPPPTSLLVVDGFDAPLSGWSTYAGSFRSNLSNLEVGTAGLDLLGRTAEVFPPDQFSEATIASGTRADTQLQVFVRRTGVNRYGFGYLDTGEWYLKYDGGPGAPMMATVPGPLQVPGDVLRVEARGSVIIGLRNGVELLRVTDARLTSGVPGVALASAVAFWTPVFAEWRGGGF